MPGDPIGDGISLPLHFSIPVYKVGDDAVPGPTADRVFVAPDGSNATIRNTMPNGAKSVFMPSAFNAISEVDPDPNNTTFVLGRILAWVAPPAPADVVETPGGILSSRINGAYPNPFTTQTEIAFVISPAGAAGPMRLEVFDLSGRRIAELFSGALNGGAHKRIWNGLSNGRASIQSGVYFVRLATEEGVVSKKLLVLKP